MNVRAVFTEVLALGMTIIFFINIFIDIAPNLWARIATFFIFITLAYYLIRSALREAQQKELLATVNVRLEQKVAEQTKEIRTAYDLEKKARRDLEKLNETKDQFIMITQHHLRTPVSNIKWELEAVEAGQRGKMTKGLAGAIETMSRATGRLVKIVDDFLSITTLKVGTPILNFTEVSLLPLVEDIFDELGSEIETKNISVSYSKAAAEWPKLNIDKSKLREALLIILENAVKYNHNKGEIKLSTSVNGTEFGMEVTNTGIGISADEKERIGNSLFFRSNEAKENNPIGMGIGLSVAKAVIRAHGGSLDIESEGKGKGAKVRVSIPVKTNVHF
jgi:signal transduction histidine kinase